MAKRKLVAADLFCGAGGTSTGLSRICEANDIELDLLAVNHWPTAIETHSKNHPNAKHICKPLATVDPRKEVKAGRLDLLVASPECTHFANARGAKPMSDQSRSSGWEVIRWAEALRPSTIIVENVREFVTWGPLDDHNRPIPEGKGAIFQAWVQSLRSMGYTVEWRVLCAADYGAATTRQRLFVLARRTKGAIRWPDQTHVEDPGLFDGSGLRRWRPAREIIDWSLRGESIFSREKPLADSTLARIEAGLRKFGGKNAEPFLVVLRQHMDARSVDSPVPTLAAGGNHVGLCQPFIVTASHGGEPNRYDMDKPMKTITTMDAWAKVDPLLIKYYGTSDASPIDSPVPTLTTKDRLGVAEFAYPDIAFRMLQPHELSAAMGFPSGYKFAGNREQRVKQIGNAVEVHQAMALCRVQVGAALGVEVEAAA